MALEIPIIDLRDDSAPANIDQACGGLGFFVAVGHGVPEGVTQAAWDAARRFFDLPIATKMRSRRVGNPYGYEPFEHENLARTRDATDGRALADRKQTLNVGPPNRGPDSGFGAFERIWPTEPYELRITWLAYYAEMERLSERLLSLFAQAMGQSTDLFDTSVDRHLAALRGLDYPSSPPTDIVVRAGAHTDYGTLTVLKADPIVPGLEVADSDGGWLGVPSVAGGFVINIGDLMQRWTNGRWRSALHRVVGDEQGRRRNSMAFFHNPNWDAVVDPILLSPDERRLFDPVVAGPWLAEKVLRSRPLGD